ncbi:hypothetical protein [Streptacidiphilus anmyonensis]|uniref:hypothetical protein n=1 Tax=Streptacidiphilus anmyonensis TaxID=405782 RepID=UPI0005AB6500|nr:hypothetical protein [Streptacidiphilus anmyonensis]
MPHEKQYPHVEIDTATGRWQMQNAGLLLQRLGQLKALYELHGHVDATVDILPGDENVLDALHQSDLRDDPLCLAVEAWLMEAFLRQVNYYAAPAARAVSLLPELVVAAADLARCGSHETAPKAPAVPSRPTRPRRWAVRPRKRFFTTAKPPGDPKTDALACHDCQVRVIETYELAGCLLEQRCQARLETAG